MWVGVLKRKLHRNKGVDSYVSNEQRCQLCLLFLQTILTMYRTCLQLILLERICPQSVLPSHQYAIHFFADCFEYHPEYPRGQSWVPALANLNIARWNFLMASAKNIKLDDVDYHPLAVGYSREVS